MSGQADPCLLAVICQIGCTGNGKGLIVLSKKEMGGYVESRY